LHSLHRQPALS